MFTNLISMAKSLKRHQLTIDFNCISFAVYSYFVKNLVIVTKKQNNVNDTFENRTNCPVFELIILNNMVYLICTS